MRSCEKHAGAKIAPSLHVISGVLICITLFSLGGVRKLSGTTHSDFAGALISSGPSSAMPKSAASMFGWLVGDWEADVYDYKDDGTKTVSKGEWHFSWVLEGRAIQDVWIVPALA